MGEGKRREEEGRGGEKKGREERVGEGFVAAPSTHSCRRLWK